MNFPARPPVGSLIAYEYLWASQFSDRADGAKTYPVAILLARNDKGPVPLAYALALPHSVPRAGDRAVIVPQKLLRHLGLATDPAWIYTDQINIFGWPGPDLRPAGYRSVLPRARGTCVIGALPADWFDGIKRHAIETYRLGLAKPLPRA